MSLLGQVLGTSPVDEDPEMARLVREAVEYQKELEFDAALQHLFVTVEWLASEIAHQFSVSYDAAFNHLFDMPNEDVRQLVTPFGWLWLAHDTAKAIGRSDIPLLKITVH